MTGNTVERLEFLSGFARWAVDYAGSLVLSERTNANPGAAFDRNPIGEDLEAAELHDIEALFQGRLPDLSPAREAQIRELAFWRWVAFVGYNGQDPRFFPLHQELFMVEVFYRTGWSRSDFLHSKIFELGCGPLGMIEFIHGAKRVAFDPLNRQYDRLFSVCRSRDIDYLCERSEIEAADTDFDLVICHNMIDHTADPDWWFDTLFRRLRVGGKFIFQVNLSSPDVPQTEEHRRMHPSPVMERQIKEWLEAKSDNVQFAKEEDPSEDGEFYFLAWGEKARDRPVRYRNMLAAETAPDEAAVR